VNVWNKTMTKLRSNPLTSGEWRKLIDRRAAPRRPLALPVEIHVHSYPSNVRLRAQLRDLSERGAFLNKPPYPLDNADEITLAIETGGPHAELCAPIPVTIIRSEGDGVAVLFDTDLAKNTQDCLARLCTQKG